MKLRRQLSLLLLCLCGTLVSCLKNNPKPTPDPDPVPTPLEIYIRVVGEDGTDRLAVNQVGQGSDYVSIEYNGQTFQPQERSIGMRNLVYTFYGLSTYTVTLANSQTVRLLSFGQFPADQNGDYSFKVKWNDGTSDVIRMVYKFQWTNSTQTAYNRSVQYYLNGMSIDERQAIPFTFVRKS